jgi:hypothetical protein
MDFIERIFGISPDGGSGSLEIACVLIVVSFLAIPFVVPRTVRLIRKLSSSSQRL